MSLSLSTSLPTCCYTHELPNIEVEADDETSVLVKVSVKDGGAAGSGYAQIYSSTYYTYSDYVLVSELTEILETYMIANNKTVLDVSISFSASGDTQAVTSTVVFCQQKMSISASALLEKHFFTSSQARFTTPEAKELLYCYRFRPQGTGIPANPFIITTFTLKVLQADGSIVEKTKVVSRSAAYGVNKIDASLSAIKVIMGSLISSSDQVLSYTVIADDAVFTFYVSHNRRLRLFYFRNCFGVYELAVLPVKTVAKTETKSSTAVCGNLSLQYDIEHTRKYEMETAALLYRQADWLTQLFTSRDIRYYDSKQSYIEEMPRVLINDYECEVSDEPGTSNAVKFEWQFADKRDAIDLAGANSNGIFTEQFSPQFA